MAVSTTICTSLKLSSVRISNVVVLFSVELQCNALSRHNHNLQIEIEELVQINVEAMEAHNHSLIHQYLNLKLEQRIACLVTSRLTPYSLCN